MTPLRLEKMLDYLHRYPDKGAVQLLEEGFRMGFHKPSLVHDFCSVHKYLSSAKGHPEVVSEKLQKEVQLGRFVDLFCLLLWRIWLYQERGSFGKDRY